MGKQVVSLILALMLSFGYTGKIIAAATDGFDAKKTSPENVLELNKQYKQSSDAQQKLEEAYSNASLKYLIGSVTSVYKFDGGQLSAIIGADQSVRLYYNGVEKGAVKKLDDEGGTYKWTSITLNDLDVKAWENYKKNSPNAIFGDYLIAAFGIKGSSETASFNDALGKIATLTGTDQTGQKSTVEQFLVAGFKSGNGAEVQLSLGDYEQETSATFSSPSGKKLSTVDYLGRTTGEYIYGNGTTVPTQYIKVGETETTGTEVTVTQFSDGTDKYKDEAGNVIPAGQPAYTWKSTLSSSTFNRSSGTSLPSAVAQVKEADKKLTTSYRYDTKTGQKISETDLSTGEVIVYLNGRPTEVYYKPADKSTAPHLKQKINYAANGNMSSVIDYNDVKPFSQSKISIYSDDGRFIASGTTQNAKVLEAQAKAIDAVINKPNVTEDEIREVLANNRDVTALNYSWQQLKNNEALFKVVFLSRNVEPVTDSSGTVTGSTVTGTAVAYENYKRAHPNATIQEIVNALAAQEEKDPSTKAASQKVWQSLKNVYNTLLNMRSDFTVQLSTEDKPDLTSKRNITSTTTITDRKGEGEVAGREHMTDTHNGQTVERGKGLFQSGVSEEDLADEKSGKGRYKAEVTTKQEYDLTVNTITTFTIKVKMNDKDVTVVDYTNKHTMKSETKHETDITKTETKYYDPAVIGEAKSFTDADGNVLDEKAAQDLIAAGKPVYIKLSPESVNMFDGSGFKDSITPKEGEEIFVKVEDQDMFDAFKGAVGTGTKVMVTGVVTNDIDGKMCLEVYNTSSGAGQSIGFGLDSTGNKGYAIGDQLNAMREEIETLANTPGSWVSKNTDTNQKIFQAAGITNSQGYLDDWKTGWNELAKLAGGGR
ncbi:MAG: hypothetical protein LBI80_05130 [Endomicrobium sp.]|jgi:hypothetical protein|nr:hypothetical protein [Endomicrobium sp.]